jgi:hypothetical protein
VLQVFVFAGWAMAVGLDSPKLLDHLVNAALLKPLKTTLRVNDFGSAGGGAGDEGDEKTYEFEAVGILTTSIPACVLCYMLMVLYDVCRAKVEPVAFSLLISHKQLHALHMERIRQFEPGERVKVINSAYMRGNESLWTEQLRREFRAGVNGRQYYRAIVKERLDGKDSGMYRVAYSDSSFETGFKRKTKVHRRMIMARDRWKWECMSKLDTHAEGTAPAAASIATRGAAKVTKGGDVVAEGVPGMLPVIKRPKHGPGKVNDGAIRRFRENVLDYSLAKLYEEQVCRPLEGYRNIKIHICPGEWY